MDRERIDMTPAGIDAFVAAELAMVEAEGGPIAWAERIAAEERAERAATEARVAQLRAAALAKYSSQPPLAPIADPEVLALLEEADQYLKENQP